jgi:cell division septum initiation protein DivIVA
MSGFEQEPPKNEGEDRTEGSVAPTRIVSMEDYVQASAADQTAAGAAPSSDAPDPDMPDTKVTELMGRPNVGEHVEAVLKAAEEAADRLLEEARMRAIAIRDGADRDASARREAAQAEADRLTEEAEAAHTEALATAEKVRAAAEEDAAAQRAEAEEVAAKLRADAERDAATFAERTQARHDELLHDTALAEDRLHRLVGGLREVADRLDGLLDEQEPTSLADTLDPSQTKLSSTVE